jgi:SSS family solute:Na+ symporter
MNITYTLITCVIFMGLVAFVSYLKTKGELDTSDGYFLAGRGLTGYFIAGSLVLTNLSAEHLIGLNGNSYRSNMSAMGWEVTAAIAIIIMALYFLPKYLGGAFTTLPEFLTTRYDETVRRYSVILFMMGYILVTIPATLYAGAIAILELFDIPTLVGISYSQSVWLIVWIVGIIGAIYAIAGGLKGVAVSDTINGVGLLIIGLLIPILGLIVLGDGSFLEGFKTIATSNPEKLSSIGGPKDSVPFSTIFTGMIYANMFYWGTNQYVIQRTLGAKSLKEGQKGVLITGFFKVLIPFFMMIPGVIAFHLLGGNLDNVDSAYPLLVTKVLPPYLSGFFLAVLLGAVLSSFDSILNSAATMFALDIYKPTFDKNADDKKLIKVSKIFGCIVALASFFVAPLLLNAPAGMFDILRKFTGFFNIPIITIVLVGLFTKKVPALSAKVVIIFHVITYYMLCWGLKKFFGLNITLNFIHIYAVLFWTEVAIMLIIAKIKPRETDYIYKTNAKVELKPWRIAPLVTVILVGFVIYTYVIFSPIGLAYANGIVSPSFWIVTILVIIMTGAFGYIAHTNWYFKYEAYLSKQHSNNVIKSEKKSMTLDK